jgi:syntaxin 1B/2/3
LDAADSTPDPALTAAIDQARGHISVIRDALRLLVRDIAVTKSQPGASYNLVETKEKQLGVAKSTFEAELQRFLRAESDFQGRYREQIARQYRVVRPDATDAEVQAAASADWSDQGIFQQALTQSSRQASAQRVLGRVRDRHVELRVIERTMAELAAVMEEMAVLIEEQEVRVDEIDRGAAQTAENLGEAKKEVKEGLRLAILVRRHKWMCFWLTLLIFGLIIGLSVGLYYTIGPGKDK